MSEWQSRQLNLSCWAASQLSVTLPYNNWLWGPPAHWNPKFYHESSSSLVLWFEYLLAQSFCLHLEQTIFHFSIVLTSGHPPFQSLFWDTEVLVLKLISLCSCVLLYIKWPGGFPCHFSVPYFVIVLKLHVSGSRCQIQRDTRTVQERWDVWQWEASLIPVHLAQEKSRSVNQAQNAT